MCWDPNCVKAHLSVDKAYSSNNIQLRRAISKCGKSHFVEKKLCQEISPASNLQVVQHLLDSLLKRIQLFGNLSTCQDLFRKLPRSIQKLPRSIQSIKPQVEIQFGRTILENPRNVFYWKDPWRMNDHLNCKIQLVLHIFGLLKQNRIKSSLLNLLSFISVLIFCMQYSTFAPWVSSALAVINSIVLGWLAWCQHSNLVFLNQALVELCQRLRHPGNEEDLHED